jgi:hypothetical protein
MKWPTTAVTVAWLFLSYLEGVSATTPVAIKGNG